MSSRIKISLPMLDLDCVLKSLDKLKYTYSIHENTRITINIGGRYPTTLVPDHTGKYILEGEDIVVKGINKNIVTQYEIIYNEKLRLIAEEEKKRLEEQRKAYIEQQRKAIVEKAKKMGYMVQQQNEEDTIKLVLVKRSYD